MKLCPADEGTARIWVFMNPDDLELRGVSERNAEVLAGSGIAHGP